MPTALNPGMLDDIVNRLGDANRSFLAAYPGDRADRQPVHTVYGGAHLFKADIAQKLGSAAMKALEEYAPDPLTFGRAIGIVNDERDGNRRTAGESTGHRHAEDARPGAISGSRLAEAIYPRVIEKLQHEPVEDFRIDFEDGYGNRSDSEEDGHTQSAA